MEVFKLSKVLFALFTIILMLQMTIVGTRRSSPCHRKCKYVEAFQQANCENRQLEAIPMECNAASYLSLRYNQITRIKPGIFRGFPFLKYLILSNNNISHIEANTFIGAPQLKSIKLLYNNLRTFDRNALNGTENRLRNIYLSRNSLRVIENGTFQLVLRLEVIDLQSNQLTHLTSDVFRDLKHLERLFLGMNKLVHLPDIIFKDLTSLVYLDLSNNSLSSLSTDLFVHMDQLRTVDASGNKLVNIGNIISLPDIRLDLRWNHLSQLGDVSLEVLNNVETLFLKGNPWNCNCSVEPLRQWYQQLSLSNEKGVKIDNPVCSLPTDLVNRKMNSLNVPLCMPDKSKETSTNSPIIITDKAISTIDLKVSEDEVGRSETSETNDQMKVVIVVLVTIIVLILVGVSFVIIKVVLSKRRLSETTTDPEINEQEILGQKVLAAKNSMNSGFDEINQKYSSSRGDELNESDTSAKEDSKRNKPKISERSQPNQLDKNETLVNEINETNSSSSSEGEEVSAKTSFIDKADSKSRRSLKYGRDLTPKKEVMKEEGSSQSDVSDTNAGDDSTRNQPTVDERSEANGGEHNETPVDEIDETSASSSTEDEEVSQKTPLINKSGSKSRRSSNYDVDLTPEREIMKEEGSNKKCSSEGVQGRTISSVRKRITPRSTNKSTGGERTKKEDSNKTRKNQKGSHQDRDELGVGVLKWD